MLTLVGCGQKPTSIVEDFFKSFQSSNLEKASSYVQGGLDDIKTEELGINEATADEIIKGIVKDFKYEDVKEVSVSDEKAEVEAKVTSVDVNALFTETIGEVMPQLFGIAFTNPEGGEDVATDMIFDALKNNLNEEDVKLVTRTVTLNLEKDTEGDYKIINDEKLQEAIFANSSKMEDKSFGDMIDEESGEEEVSEEPHTSKVIKTIDENKQYDAKPMVLNIQEISFKKASNVSTDEQDRINWITEKEIGTEFEYLYIKFNAENTSDEDVDFQAIQEVTVFANGKQETVDSLNYDFIDYDEYADGAAFYGKVNKDGEIGLTFDTKLQDVEKIRLQISPVLNSETYESYADSQVVEMEISK
ncbi:hypothetical protein R4Z10_07780 [Niallia sp. XMNu-256]|uniref:hypothetical protein n=1 Tax=Niallia sp. XMNu-256 TaxID=3082444 RepID=UPI0030D4FF92